MRSVLVVVRDPFHRAILGRMVHGVFLRAAVIECATLEAALARLQERWFELGVFVVTRGEFARFGMLAQVLDSNSIGVRMVITGSRDPERLRALRVLRVAVLFDPLTGSLKEFRGALEHAAAGRQHWSASSVRALTAVEEAQSA